jgi:predicted MFS family arabinose efflux permease
VRGAGFAVLTVLGATLTAQVAPPARRGEAIGLYGLAIAVPNLVAVPAGAALVLDGHGAWVAWLAAAPVLGVPLVRRLVRAAPPSPPPDRGTGRGAVRAAVVPSVVLFVTTVAGGGVVTFLPIERPDGALATVALLVMGVTAAGSRWRAGLLADRIGNRLLLPAAVLIAAAGLVVLAAGLSLGGAAVAAAVVVAGAAVFGAGFGAAQNLTLLATFARAGERRATTASAFWNAAFDAGTGAGAFALGPLIGGIGLPWTFGLVAAALAVVLPVARAAARPVS